MSLCALGSPGPSRLAGVRASSLSCLHAPPECSPYHGIPGGVGRIAKVCYEGLRQPHNQRDWEGEAVGKIVPH